MLTDDIRPDAYRYWVLTIDPPVARLTARGADGLPPASAVRAEIELSDALQRLRFEHPDVGGVVVTGAPGHESAIEAEGGDSGLRWLTAPNGPLFERGPVSEAVRLLPLWREEFDRGFAYPNVRVEFDDDAGEAAVTIVGPCNVECFAPEPGPRRLRSRWWPLAVCRELDDALRLFGFRTPEVRTVVVRTEGDPLAVASADVALTSGYEHDWFVREVVLFWRRTLWRLERGRPSVVARVEPGSCFVGTLFELALAADRIAMVDAPEVQLYLTGVNFGPLPRADGVTRLEWRFPGASDHVAELARRVGDPITAGEAAELGLVTEVVAGQVPGGSGASR